jgi:type I restriction enzyme S subunit
MAFEAKPFGELFLTSQKNGLTRPKKVRGSGLPMVNMGELFAHARIRNIEMDLVPVSDAESSFLLEPGDLLFARQSLVRSGAGQCSIFLGNTKATVFESHLIRCRLRSTEFNPLFYYYFFRSPIGREVMDTIIEQGAGASGIRGSDLVKLPVPCPPKDDQDQISESLNALDNKIALLRETNAALEAIAQALFKSWFVDFDPVRAKAEGRDPVGVPPEVADLFPSEFEDSELGAVPKGWESCMLDEACEVNPTRRLQKGTDAPYLEMSALPTSGHRPDTPVARTYSSGTKFIDGDSLLARITPCLENGKTAFVDFLGKDVVGWGSTEFIVIRPRAPLPTYWGYLLCRQEPFRQFAIQAMAGTSGRQRVDVSRLVHFRVALPSAPIAKAFAETVEPIQKRIAANDDQAKTLANLRDTLLPRLMSGKLRIPDVEEVLA